jgi:hypothetical protein
MLSGVNLYSLVDNLQISTDCWAKLLRQHDRAKHTMKHFDDEYKERPCRIYLTRTNKENQLAT